MGDKLFMKNLYLALILILSIPAYGASANDKDALIEKIFTRTRMAKFLEMVDQIKGAKDIGPANPFAPSRELGAKKRELWQNFPAAEYSSGFKKQFLELFEARELREIAMFYENPFRSKILVQLNTDALLVGLLEKLATRDPTKDLERVAMSRNKVTLLQSVINLHKINPLIEDQREDLKTNIRRQRKLLEILKDGVAGKAREALEANEALLQNFDAKVIRYFGKAFEGVSESELREIVRVMSDKKNGELIQNAAQLLVSYHYYFLKKYFQTFQTKD